MLEAALYAAGRPVDMESMKVVVRTKSDKVIGPEGALWKSRSCRGIGP
jgi:hypothetical protein